MKIFNNIIIFLLCVSLIGFFANFAQNDYGAVLTACSFWIISGCFFVKAVHEVTILKKGFAICFATLFLCFLLSYFSEDFLVWIFMFLIVFITAFFPLVGFVIERKRTEKTNWLFYFRFTFLGYLFIGIYFKELHFMGAGVLISLSLLLVLNFIIELIYQRKAIVKNSHGLLYFIFSLEIIVLIVATTFKIQHWPGSNLMFKLSPYLFLGLLLVMIYNIYKKKEPLPNFNIDAKILLVIVVVINLHGVLRYFQIVPKIYRNEMPNAYFEIEAKANDVTEEGKRYMLVKKDFIESYEALFEQIQETRDN